jgi:hypothetical protein
LDKPSGTAFVYAAAAYKIRSSCRPKVNEQHERVANESQLRRASTNSHPAKNASTLLFMRGRRQGTDRSKSFAKITSVRASFRTRWRDGAWQNNETGQPIDRGDRSAEPKMKSALNFQIFC